MKDLNFSTKNRGVWGREVASTSLEKYHFISLRKIPLVSLYSLSICMQNLNLSTKKGERGGGM